MRDLHPQRLSSPLRSLFAQPHGGAVEVALLFALYGVYELVRGFGHASYDAAKAHTDEIVALEQRLGVYVERGVQEAAEALPGLPATLGFLYMALHLVLTPAVLVWAHRYHREHFAMLRTTFVVATALSLAIYVLYPAAPPRLAGLGFADTVTHSTGLNLSSDFLGSLYNPFAAVPSLHFGYAFLVGVAVAALATGRVARVAGALYPALMLFIIVATGNHFVFDAVAGGVVVVAGWWVARTIVAERTERRARRFTVARAA